MGGWFSKEAIIVNENNKGVLTITQDHMQQIILILLVVLVVGKIHEYYKDYMKKKAFKFSNKIENV